MPHLPYNEWKTGKREEGTVYSLHSFFRKLAQMNEELDARRAAANK